MTKLNQDSLGDVLYNRMLAKYEKAFERAEELQAKLDTVKNCKTYTAFDVMSTTFDTHEHEWMFRQDVLAALQEQKDE